MFKKKRLLIVDGYNVLNAWRPDLGRASIDDARDQLTDRLQNFAGYSGQRVIVVYDAWMSERRARTVEEKDGLTVVFTQKGETADHYIERLTDTYARDMALDRLEVRVATSDFVEQTVVMGRGAARMSARELIAEMEHMGRDSAARASHTSAPARSTVMERMPQDMRQKLERMRRGEG